MHIELAKMKRSAHMLLIVITFSSRSLSCFTLGQSTSATNISARESSASVTTNIRTDAAALLKDILAGISKFMFKICIAIEVTKDRPEVTLGNKSTFYEAVATTPFEATIVPEVTAASANHLDREKTNTTPTTANNKDVFPMENRKSHDNGTLISDEPSERSRLFIKSLDLDRDIEASPEVVAYFARFFKDVALTSYRSAPLPSKATTLVIDQFFKKATTITPRMKEEYALVYPFNETYFGYKLISRKP